MAELAILLTARFQSAIQNLDDADFARVEAALQILPKCFGRPHAHGGISIRRLRKNVFECRAGLKLRLLFRENAGALEFFFAGNHDEVRRLIKGL